MSRVVVNGRYTNLSNSPAVYQAAFDRLYRELSTSNVYQGSEASFEGVDYGDRCNNPLIVSTAQGVCEAAFLHGNLPPHSGRLFQTVGFAAPRQALWNAYRACSPHVFHQLAFGARRATARRGRVAGVHRPTFAARCQTHAGTSGYAAGVRSKWAAGGIWPGRQAMPVPFGLLRLTLSPVGAGAGLAGAARSSTGNRRAE